MGEGGHSASSPRRLQPDWSAANIYGRHDLDGIRYSLPQSFSLIFSNSQKDGSQDVSRIFTSENEIALMTLL